MLPSHEVITTTPFATAEVNMLYDVNCNVQTDVNFDAVKMDMQNCNTESENSNSSKDGSCLSTTSDAYLFHDQNCNDHLGVNSEQPTATATAVVNAQDCSTEEDVNSDLPADGTSPTKPLT
jgi:hypothetical protein